MFSGDRLRFSAAILNPPYRKFQSASRPRQLLRRLGLETSNLYAAFLALSVSLLEDGAEFVSITPRSFCNGPYFLPLRSHLLRHASLSRLHVFESRSHAFRDDGVLQENVILHAVKGVQQGASVMVSQSASPGDPEVTLHQVPFSRVVTPGDGGLFIHLVPNSEGGVLAEAMDGLPCTLADLGISVSTGRVVDFRARGWLRLQPEPQSVPLIYPGHFADGRIAWPKVDSRKPNAIALRAASAGLLVPAGVYVLVKRFSAKEERRRVVAAVFDPRDVPCEQVGFENHVNYFHAHGSPLDPSLARGLALFLNSSRVDAFFRQFNGHTQVNAADLRRLRYPTSATLVEMGKRVTVPVVSQAAVDEAVAFVLDVGVGA